jgi:hypothetical protein
LLPARHISPSRFTGPRARLGSSLNTSGYATFTGVPSAARGVPSELRALAQTALVTFDRAEFESPIVCRACGRIPSCASPCVARRAKHTAAGSIADGQNILLYRISALAYLWHTSSRSEGRIAIVTKRGVSCGGRRHIGARGIAGRETVSESRRAYDRCDYVRQNRVVLAPGVCAPSLVVMWRPNRSGASVIC